MAGQSYSLPERHFKFVPVTSAKQANDITGQAKASNLVTGYYQCRLITATPFAIPDTDMKNSPFIRVNDRLTIPGSSLRGVFRSIYEAVTNSCVMRSNRDDEWRTKAPTGIGACTSRTKLCKGCALFGMVGSVGSSVGSRVRFADAVSTQRPQTETNIQLKEQYAPKVTEGRKFYTHDPGMAYKDVRGNQRGARMEVVTEEGVEFSFRVYYDNVTKAQRNELAWALTLGANSTEDRHLIKFGHGKSLGMGSAKVLIEGVAERSFDPDKKEGAYSLTEVTDREQIQKEYVTPGADELQQTAVESLLAVSEYTGAFEIKEAAPVVVPLGDREPEEGMISIRVHKVDSKSPRHYVFARVPAVTERPELKGKDILCHRSKIAQAEAEELDRLREGEELYAVIRPNPQKAGQWMADPWYPVKVHQ